jgi:hypothetical protein
MPLIDKVEKILDSLERKPAENHTTQRTTPARGRAPTQVDDQATLATKADTTTPQRNTAEANIRSRRSDIHAGPKAAPTD